jgi:chromosome segregation ATPase
MSEINRLADFILKYYGQEIGLGNPIEGESAVDVAIRLLTPQSSPSVTDLLANLARRVSSLEQQLSSTQSNVEKLAEELANTKHRVSKHATMFGIVEERVGMLTDDIITLDERSQVLNAINKFYEDGSR